jgi:hypothetical protein
VVDLGRWQALPLRRQAQQRRDDRAADPEGGVMVKPVIHGPSSQAEFMLCGYAFDAFGAEIVIEAEAGETVTCPECRAVIDYMRKAYPRGYKFTGEVLT